MKKENKDEVAKLKTGKMKVEDELRSAILEKNLLRDSERILLNTFDTLKMHYDAKKNKEEEIKEKRTDETFKCQKCSFKTDSRSD